MTIEEAVKMAEARKEAIIELAIRWPEDAEMALRALKKQKPEDLYLEGDGYANGLPMYDTARCPGCDEAFEIGKETRSWKYCPLCGHAWKWPDAPDEEDE